MAEESYRSYNSSQNYLNYQSYQNYQNYRISQPTSRLISIEIHEFVGVAEVGEDAAETVVRDN